MGYAAAARRLGARIVRHCEVLDVAGDAGSITEVITTNGRIKTDTVVCAAGAWSRQIGEMLGVTIPVTPVRRQIAFTEPLTDCPPSHTIAHDRFPSSFYFHPEGRGLLLGWSDPDQTTWVQPALRTRRLARGPWHDRPAAAPRQSSITASAVAGPDFTR